jgi:hypothetical protein
MPCGDATQHTSTAQWSLWSIVQDKKSAVQQLVYLAGEQ